MLSSGSHQPGDFDYKCFGSFDRPSSVNGIDSIYSTLKKQL